MVAIDFLSTTCFRSVASMPDFSETNSKCGLFLASRYVSEVSENIFECLASRVCGEDTSEREDQIESSGV